MGSFEVEFLNEGVELGLLLEAVHAGRPGCLLLEGQVHALVTAVLLRLARLDALDGDTERFAAHAFQRRTSPRA